MTAIPQEILDAVQSTEEPVAYHNWMYSFSPGRLPHTLWGNSNEHPVSEIGIWLVGYCKLCNRAFSFPIPVAYVYQEVETNIPKTGCIIR
jgi:hypothetical protein